MKSCVRACNLVAHRTSCGMLRVYHQYDFYRVFTNILSAFQTNIVCVTLVRRTPDSIGAPLSGNDGHLLSQSDVPSTHRMISHYQTHLDSVFVVVVLCCVTTLLVRLQAFLYALHSCFISISLQWYFGYPSMENVLCGLNFYWTVYEKWCPLLPLAHPYVL